MTGGTEFQEAAEAPQESREVSESKEQLDRAAFEPEAAVERIGDINQAEDVQKTFVAAVPSAEVVPLVETPPAGSSLDGKSHDPGDHFSGVEMTQGEVLEDNDLNTGPSQSVATDIASQQAAQVQEVGQPDQKSSERISEEKTEIAKTELTKPEGSTAQKEADSQIEEKAGETSGAALPDESPPENPFTELASDLDDTAIDISVVDSEDSPVKLTEVSSSSDTENFSQDMARAKPGEVRGFVNDQEDNPYILETSGESGELDKNQIAIPASDGQIDFAGNIRKTEPVDHFLSALEVATDETGDFRVPGLHGDQPEIPAPDEPTVTNRYEPVWGDGPAPEGLLSRVEDNTTVPKDQLVDGPSLQETDDGVEEMEEKLNETGDSADSPVLTQEQISELESIQELINEGGGEADIDTLIQLVMFEVYESEEDHLNDILEDMKASNEAKQKMREMITELNKQKNKMKESMREEYAGEIKGDAQLAAEMTESPGILEEAVVEGSDLRSTEDVTKELEEKLNEVGDDAQLANIEMMNASRRLGQLTGMLSSISKTLEDNPISDIRKVSGGGDSDPADTSESSGESAEEGTDPALEAEAAALVEEVLAAETPEDAAALVQSVLRESYTENSQDLAFYAQKVKFFNECKKEVRTYLAELKNSINTISEGEDGTKIEEKAQDLNEADSQANSEGTESEYSYQLVEGRILVGESEVAEPTDNADEDEDDGEDDDHSITDKTNSTQDSIVENIK